jgi:hypothetical protein
MTRVVNPHWSRFYDFGEIIEYYGLFDETGKSSRKEVKHNSKRGRPHSDNGFRLRSRPANLLSFSDKELAKSIEEVPCPLHLGDWGCYFVQVRLENERWDYIGKAKDSGHQKSYGIWYRLYHHMIKIAGTTGANSGKSTVNFDAMRERASMIQRLEVNTPEFFSRNVKVALLKIESKDNDLSRNLSAQAERNAHRFYKEICGHLPKLCDKDESKNNQSDYGLAGLVDLIQ